LPTQDLGADYGERAEREPITGVWERNPSGVQGQSPWWGIRGLDAESFFVNFPTERGQMMANVKI